MPTLRGLETELSLWCFQKSVQGMVRVKRVVVLIVTEHLLSVSLWDYGYTDPLPAMNEENVDSSVRLANQHLLGSYLCRPCGHSDD